MLTVPTVVDIMLCF